MSWSGIVADKEPKTIELPKAKTKTRKRPKAQHSNGAAPNGVGEDKVEELNREVDQADKVELDYFKRYAPMSEDEALTFMNERHAAVMEGRKLKYTCRLYDELYEREVLATVDRQTIVEMYEDRHVEVHTAKGRAIMKLAKWWLENAGKRKYDGLMMDPSEGATFERDGKLYLNRWEGFNVVPKKGDWKDFLAHIYRILCNSKPESFKYVIKWIAWTLQNPGSQAETIIAFRGKKGTGKGIVGKQLLRIFGVHGAQVSDRNRLVGRFNKILMAPFVFADEAFWPGNKEAESILKAITTEDNLQIEEKFKDVINYKNRLHLFMSSNEDWVVPASTDERRFFVEDVSDRYARGLCSDEKRELYFTRICALMEPGGREAMLHDLLGMDLKGWHPRERIPTTKALRDQIDISRNFYEECFIELLESGNNLSVCERDIEGRFIIPSKSIADYCGVAPEKQIQFMKRLRPFLDIVGATRMHTKKGKAWSFPSKKACVRNWNAKRGGALGVSEDVPEWSASLEQF